MATNCSIAIKLKPEDIWTRITNSYGYSLVPKEKYLEIYCHYDGYIKGGVGEELNNSYDNYDAALALVMDGDHRSIDDPFLNSQQDRDWINVKPGQVEEPHFDEEYNYVFEDNTWFVSYYNGNTITLEDAILGENMDNIDEGFFNPYDSDEDLDKDDLSLNSKPDIYVKPTDKNLVKGVKLWDHNRKNKTYLKDNKVYSSRIFVKDDVVEECPVKLISTSSLYSPEIRDLAIEVDPERRLYGIPFGFANNYRTSDDTGELGNIDYEYDPKEGIIRIYAIKKIHPNEELVFQVKNDRDFVNQVKKYQFKY